MMDDERLPILIDFIQYLIKTIFKGFLLIGSVYSQGGGYALDFDGSNDYSQHGTNSSLRPTSAITLEAWINIHSNSNWESAVSYATDNGATESGYDLFCKGAGSYKWSFRVARNGMSEGEWATDPYAFLTILQWIHVAGTYDGTTVCFYENGVLSTSETHSGNIDWNPSPNKFSLGRFHDSDENNYFDGYLDEVRIWSDARTATEIQEYMHQELAGNESNLVAYFKMSDGSGTTITDDSQNSNTGTMVNMNNSDWVTSQAPIGDLGSSYETDVEGVWKSTGTSESDASDGLTMTVGSALSTGNFAVFGNNNTNATSTSDLGSVASTVRTGRIWQVDESGTVAATIKIDMSDATGISGNTGTASNYRLLYRSGTSGDFSSAATGSSISGDVVTFNSVSLQDGYYALGAQSDATLPVELTSFELMNTREDAITLQWVTESEINNLGFNLDRRTPLTDWTQIASYVTHPALQGQGSVSHQTIYTFTDNTVQENESYDYRLSDVDYDGNVEYHSLQLMGVSSSKIPEQFILYPNYPNPFNPVTTIRYDLSNESFVDITIYDMLGNVVNNLVNTSQSYGYKSIQWNATNNQGEPVSAGVYLYKIQAGNFVDTKKMILLK